MVTSKSKSDGDPRDAVLRIARQHFATHGFHGASLKDIAAEAGTANSLIHYHFGDKDGLFAACLETFARDKMAAVRRILSEPRNQDELRVRLELFVEEMVSSIAADPYGFDIMDREVRAGNPAVTKIFQETLLVAFHSTVAFFKSALARGLLREDADPTATAILLFTSTCDAARKEHLAKKFFNLSLGNPEWRARFIRDIVGLFTHGVIK